MSREATIAVLLDELADQADINDHGSANDAMRWQTMVQSIRTDHAARVAELEAELREQQEIAAHWSDLAIAEATRATAAEGEVGRLRGLIDEHNAGCIARCANKAHCGYAPYARQCPTCPADDVIELPEALAQQSPGVDV
jgi:hypothetical protein